MSDADYVLIPHLWAEVRHCPGKADDGKVTVWNQREMPESVHPDDGINGHKGTWTTVHRVYFDPYECVQIDRSDLDNG